MPRGGTTWGASPCAAKLYEVFDRLKSPAALLPDSIVNGEALGEDCDLIRSLIIDWKFSGMFLSDGERYTQEPDRVTLERSALRIVRVLTQK